MRWQSVCTVRLVVGLLLVVGLWGCEKPTVQPEEPPSPMRTGGWWECVALGKNPITTPAEREDASEKIMAYINLLLLEKQGSPVYEQVRAQVRDCMVELQQLGVRLVVQDSAVEVHAPQGVEVQGKGKWHALPVKDGSASASTEVTFPTMVLQSPSEAPVYRKQFVEYYSGKKVTLESQDDLSRLLVPGRFVCDPIADKVTALGLTEKGKGLRDFGLTFKGFSAVLGYLGDNPSWVK